MPNTKQARKRVQTDDRRRIHNKALRSAMRTAVRKVLEAEDGAAAEKALPEAVRRIDKAAKVNVIHANTAARRKARLHRVVRSKQA